MDSAQNAVRSWFREALQTDDPVSLPLLARQCVDELRQDAGFLESFIEDALYSLAYNTGKSVLSNDRSLVSLGGDFTRREDLIREVKKRAMEGVASAIWKWKEYDPSLKQYISLHLMTKEQLFLAAQHRQLQAEANATQMAFIKMLANPMKPGQQVRDVWTEEEMIQMKAKIDITIGVGLKGVGKKVITRKAA